MTQNELKEEMILRILNAFNQNGCAIFTWKDLNVIAKNDYFKPVIKDLEAEGEIENQTKNGFAQKYKLNKILDCPDFLFIKELENKHRYYLLNQYLELEKYGKIKTTDLSKDLQIKNKTGKLPEDILNDSKPIVKNILETNEKAELTESGEIKITASAHKEHKCQYCGETNPDNFRKNCKSVCKKCEGIHSKRKGSISLSEWLYKRSMQNFSRFNKTRKLEYNLTPNYIQEILDKQNNKCAYSGYELDKDSDDKLYIPTIDRIDPTKGYVEGNICICSWAVNTMKMDLQLDEWKKLIEDLSKNLN